MKNTLTFCCLLALAVPALADKRDVVIEQLRAENKVLRAQVDSLKKRIDKLEKLLKKDGPEEQVKTPEEPKQFRCVYRGRVRSKRWFDRMYKEFHDKIAVVDGKYIDIGKAKLKPSDWTETAGEFIDIGKGGVVSVVSRDTISVYFKGETYYTTVVSTATGMGRTSSSHIPSRAYTIKSNCVSKYKDGSPYKDSVQLICIVGKGDIGPDKKIAAVPIFVEYTPLTKDQFNKALASGFVLKRHIMEIVEKKSPSMLTGRMGRRRVPSFREITIP